MLMKMRGQMQKGRNQKGFTLVELMVVVLIIGILVAIAVPVYRSVQTKAAENACAANVRTLNGALEAYKANNDFATLPNDFNAENDLVGKYIKEWPTGPLGGDYTLGQDDDIFVCDHDEEEE